MKDQPIIEVGRREFLAGLAATSLVPLTGCETNPVTGRSQLMIITDEMLVQHSKETWSSLMSQASISSDPQANRRLGEIGRRCVDAADQGHLDWEFVVVSDSSINAFVLPGGKVMFHQGLMDTAENDDQIAAVMGHEIGHVVGRHAAERASQNFLLELGVTIVQATDSGGGQWAAVLGAGAMYGIILPYSREHEYEADSLGLRYMHKAGYDGQEAVNFWKLMIQESSGEPLEFLSTHPAHRNRMERLQEQASRLA